jgi:hypothetical protein
MEMIFHVLEIKRSSLFLALFMGENREQRKVISDWQQLQQPATPANVSADNFSHVSESIKESS